MQIRDNVFRHCLTSKYQFCTAVIAVSPTVENLAGQKTPYHRGISIIGNTFDCPGAKLYDAISAEEPIWRD